MANSDNLLNSTQFNGHTTYPKGWGFETWIVNNSLYCGKILHFKAGKRCSYHYHKLKTETFYLQDGLVRVLYSMDSELEQANIIELKPGESFHIPVGLRHQILAVKESNLFEFSTQHFESDSYRLVKGD